MCLKSGLVPEINVFPIMSAIIQAPPETDLDLLPSEAIINFLLHLDSSS